MPKYGLSLAHISPYLDRMISAVSLVRTDIPVLSKYGKIWIRENPYFGIFYALLSCAEFL